VSDKRVGLAFETWGARFSDNAKLAMEFNLPNSSFASDAIELKHDSEQVVSDAFLLPPGLRRPTYLEGLGNDPGPVASQGLVENTRSIEAKDDGDVAA
jgi:hypothetical protein